MGMRLRGLLVMVLCVSALAAGSARAADSGPPADGPDLSTMVLEPADFASGGASSGGRWFTSGSVPGYLVQSGCAQVWPTKLLISPSVMLAQTDAVVAAADIANARTLLSTPAGRAAFVKTLNLPGAGGKHVKVVVGLPHKLSVGDEGFQFPITYVTGKKRQSAMAEFVRVDRVEGFLLALQNAYGKPFPAPVGTAQAVTVATRMRAGLAVAAVAAPAISGSPQQGQTLSADHGHWTGGPSAFSYQWSRCDAAGANCTAIAGATQPSYVPSSAD
ncbi:MAG TPA: hypothetical protein VF327_02540, partial [Gaiellaceae bacterium]